MTDVSFAALSYVWGDRLESNLYLGQTTVSNVERLEQHGSLHNLPKIVEDAIQACQLLQIHYLWVDRFCIVQDYAVNKHSQIEAMGEILYPPILTIVACSGESVHCANPEVCERRRFKPQQITILGLEITTILPHLEKTLPN